MLKSEIKVSITGISTTIAILKAKEAAIKVSLSKQIKKSTEELKDEVKQSVRGLKAEPRSIDTGDFLKSVQGQSKELVGVVSSVVPQSVFMEFGTSKVPERRHFRNSLDRKKKKINDDLDKAVNIII